MILLGHNSSIKEKEKTNGNLELISSKRENFEGRELIIVFPEKANGKCAIKTEYFDAFPEVQIELLKQGYHIVHMKI